LHIIRFDDNYRIKSKLIVVDDLIRRDAVPIKAKRRGASVLNQILWFDFSRQETLFPNFLWSRIFPPLLNPYN